MLTGKKFCNKIWNASRFVLQNANSKFKIQNSKLQFKNKNLTEADKKILKDLEKIIKEVSDKIEKYEFGQALHKLYDFFWHDFCDIYIEKSKKQASENTSLILFYVLSNSLKLLHPFLPFITEEIWNSFNEKKLLLVEDWPR